MCTSPLGLAYAWIPYRDTSNLAFTREISTATALRGDTAPLTQTVPHSNTGLPIKTWHCYMILNSLVASAQHDGAHRRIRIWVLPILEHVRVGESSNVSRSPSTDHRLSSHRQPSTLCQRVLSIDGTFGWRTGRNSQTDSTLQPTSSPAQRQNRTQPIKHGAQQSYQLRRRPSRGGAARAWFQHGTRSANNCMTSSPERNPAPSPMWKPINWPILSMRNEGSGGSRRRLP